MNDTDVNQFERYVERGVHRGADVILRNAREGALPEYVDGVNGADDMVRRRRNYRHVFAAAASLILVVALGFAASQRRSGPGSVDSVTPAAEERRLPEWMTPEKLAEFDRQTAELAATGWVALSTGRVLTSGDAVPQVGYFKITTPGDSRTPAWELDGKGLQRVAVYDRPDGAQIGYFYNDLGFAHKAPGDDPSFDARALYAQYDTCVPTDEACHKAQMAEIVPRNPPDGTR